MKNLFSIKYFLLAMLAVSVFSCDSDDPEPVNEEELITTLKVTFTGTGNTTGTEVATFQDLDGEGGDAPEIEHPTLEANGTYNVTVEFLNETESPAEDITEEVEEEGDEHQVFFVTTGAEFTYAYNDEDGDGNPLGLNGTATTGAESTGTLQVLLIHEPNKTATEVADGNPANAGGETDISVTFNLTIQ